MQRVFCLILLALSLPSRAQDDRIGIRMITVRTEAEAARLRGEIQAGASFEGLARAHSVDASAGEGGYLGLFRPTDLRPELQRALQGLGPGAISAVTAIGNQFVLLQRLSQDETNWIVSNDAGLQSFQQNRYEEAARSFLQAVQYAEKLTPVDYRLEDSLHGLAESYRLQKKYAEAEPFYRRYLAAHWGGPTAPEVLDRCAALLTLAYFHDSQFDEALRRFDEAVARAPLGE